jgi:outer membrane cobalamin receptor
MVELLFSLLLAFDLRGLVLDPSGRPIPGAQVACAGSEPTTTDASGRFTLPGEQPCGARVSKSGFTSVSNSLEPSRETTIRLPLASQSDSVVVTASPGAPIALEEAGIAASIITSQQLTNRQAHRVADVLRDVPGINIVQTGSNGAITSLFTRGGDSNATLVLLDGIPVTDPGGSLNLTGLATAALDRVEVVRGPESALFGAEAANGVIQMFTKHGDPEATRPHGLLQYERGSFSTDHWTAGVDGGLFNRFDYALTTDQYRSTGEFPNNGFRSTTGTANVGVRIAERTSVRAIFREFDSFAGAPGQTLFGAWNLDGRADDRDSIVGIKLEDARGNWFSHRANFGYHRYRNRNEDLNTESYTLSALVRDVPGQFPGVYLVRPVPAGSAADAGTRLVNTTITNFGGSNLNITDRTDAGYQATMNHTGGSFVAGYTFEGQSGLITGANVDRTNHGISLYEQFGWRQRVFLSGGARIEQSSVFGTRFAPRGAVTFRLPTETYLRLSVARGIKQPTLLESFAKASFFVGNPNLRPAQTDAFEAGLSREWWNRRVRTEASYFRNNVTDLIQFVSGPPPAFIGSWDNVQRVWSRGVELTTSAKVVSFVAVRGSYTRLATKIVSSGTVSDIGQTLLRRPANSGTISIDVTPKRWTVTLGARVIGESRDSFAAFGVNRISGYQPMFLSASWQATKNVAPFLRINNLSDQQYWEVAGYRAWSRNAAGGVRITW